MKLPILMVLVLTSSGLPVQAQTMATATAAPPAATPPGVVHEPLTSTVGANAEITVQPQAVLLGHLKGLVVEAHNGTDRPLLFDGDHALATIGSAHYQSVPLSAIDNTAHPVKGGGQKFERALRDTVVAAVTIGAYQTVRDASIQAGPILKRYGWDEARREDEITRFGKRILWPGDSSKGVVYFMTSASLTGACVEMPVNSIYDTGDKASIKTSP